MHLPRVEKGPDALKRALQPSVGTAVDQRPASGRA